MVQGCVIIWLVSASTMIRRTLAGLIGCRNGSLCSQSMLEGAWRLNVTSGARERLHHESLVASVILFALILSRFSHQYCNGQVLI
jgi:hypothetical protein